MLITAIHIVSLKSFHTVKPFNMPTTPIPYIVDPSGQPPTRPYSHSFKDAYTLCEGLVCDLVVEFVSGLRRKQVLRGRTQISSAEVVESISSLNTSAFMTNWFV